MALSFPSLASHSSGQQSMSISTAFGIFMIHSLKLKETIVILRLVRTYLFIAFQSAVELAATLDKGFTEMRNYDLIKPPCDCYRASTVSREGSPGFMYGQ
ncbi:hypothetical protein AcV7_009201 [Taiwanofungus camphoratus]|nr:hypothetical protein AcV7_009201 [Antrodia cinnamomea]